ncbi:hypothetical protein [Rhizobium sp. L9]|uniref:hypothetical protein n=1 Tax=Rhizobium sp. L9 TaxID=1340738 RepID=UPI00114473C4|nr:hypothetical protein [Rhizobium sp. L9]
MVKAVFCHISLMGEMGKHRHIRLREALILGIYPTVFLLFIWYNYFSQYNLVLNHKILGDEACYNNIRLHYLRHVAASAGFLATYFPILVIIRIWRTPTGAGVSAFLAAVVSVLVAGQLVSKFVCT